MDEEGSWTITFREMLAQESMLLKFVPTVEVTFKSVSNENNTLWI